MECTYWNKGDSAFIIKRGKMRYVFSYGVLVAKCKVVEDFVINITLSEKWNFSKTTKKSVCWFLKKDSKQIRDEIKCGSIKVKSILG